MNLGSPRHRWWVGRQRIGPGETSRDWPQRLDPAGAVTDYAFIVLDLDGRIRTWDTGARLTTGHEADEIVGCELAVLYPAEYAAAGRPGQALKTALQTGSCEEETWRVRRDGERYWASVVITPIRDHDGSAVGYVEVSRDMTERTSADESTSRRRLLEQRHELAARLATDVVGSLFAIGMALQSAASMAADPKLARRLDVAVGELEAVILTLRREIFGMATPV